MYNFPPLFKEDKIGNGGGREEKLCNARAAKQECFAKLDCMLWRLERARSAPVNAASHLHSNNHSSTAAQHMACSNKCNALILSRAQYTTGCCKPQLDDCSPLRMARSGQRAA
jgi:hypothetical protein